MSLNLWIDKEIEDLFEIAGKNDKFLSSIFIYEYIDMASMNKEWCTLDTIHKFYRLMTRLERKKKLGFLECKVVKINKLSVLDDEKEQQEQNKVRCYRKRPFSNFCKKKIIMELS